MTVMFCDLVGSTPLAESLDPEDLRDVILGYQQAAARAIESFDGHIARYMGDGILVYFGYPRAHEDDAQRAVHAGLGILEALAALNRQLNERYDLSLHARIGVHTGLVVAGEMGGGETRDELAIVGETPNIAARIESIADTDSMAISDTTLALVDGFFETKPMGDRVLKGVSRKVLTHRVIRATGVQNRLDVAVSGGVSLMVGRDGELDIVADAWSKVRGGDGAVAHVYGEAGIGKSRFIRALRDRLGDDVAEVEVWRCSAYHQNSALFPVIDHLERTLGLDVEHRGDQALALLEASVRDAGLEQDENVPLLAELLSIPHPDARDGRTLASLDVRAATMRTLESLLVTSPLQHPLLLLVEDLHWADATTIDLLRRVVRAVASCPVLAVFTFRPDFSPPWSHRAGVVDVALKPLSTDEVSSMVAAAGSAAVDKELLARVVEAADGVPLYVEEMLKMLGAAEATPSTDRITVPSTLRSLLTERLDRLPHLRDVIDAAAVVGRDVSRELLQGLAPLQSIDVDAALAALVAQDVLRPRIEGPISGYEFSHALLQEAAYDSVLRTRRQELHCQVAEVFVDRFSARAEREPEVVAHHFFSGGQSAKSVPYWHAAGLRALERAAFVEAAEHFGRGVDALQTNTAPDADGERAEFLSHLAASLQAGRGYAAPGVDEAYAEARSACVRARREDRLVSVIRGEWMFHLLRAEYGTAFELANEMLALSGRTGRQEDLAEGNLFRGMVHMYRGDLESARLAFEHAIDHYHPPERSDQVYEAQGDTGVGALAYLAPVLANLGFVDEAFERSNQCLELADKVGGPVTRAQAWGMRTLFHLGRNEAVLYEWAERTRAHSADRNIPYWRNVSELITAWLRGRTGQVDAGIADMGAGLERYFGSGARLGLPVFRILLADLRELAGDNKGALAELEAAETFIDGTGERWSEPVLLLAKARTLMSADVPDPAAAGEAYVRALDAARYQRAKLLELRSVTHLTMHQLALGQPCTECDALADLCDWFPASSTLADVSMGRGVLAKTRDDA